MEKPCIYLVVLNREDIIGEFKNREDAKLFAYICALHGDKDDNLEVYVTTDGFLVGE